MQGKLTTEERFWSYVDRCGGEDACWVWTGGRLKGGYGAFQSGGRTRRAHQFSWLLAHGPRDHELCVLHRCDNPPCCNPAHLFLGTVADNNLDCEAKGRRTRVSGEDHPLRREPSRASHGEAHYSKTKPEVVARGERHGSKTQPESRAKGEGHGGAILTKEAVRTIRRMRGEGWVFQKIADALGISYTAARNAATGVTWKHIG